MQDLALLLLRLTLGGLLTGHGAQKLFGAFEGHGLEGTAGWFESALGLKPGERWALAAGAGELMGGVLTTLGFMHPLGPVATFGPMIVAWGRVHWNKPIWVTSGGGELPATNLAIAVALTLAGPGRISLDRLLGIRVPPALAVLAAGCVAAGAMTALTQPRQEQQEQLQAAATSTERAEEPQPAGTI
jgi:putative oxidoreductase